MTAERRAHQDSPKTVKQAEHGRFRPIGIPAVNAAARQMRDWRAEDARRNAEKAREIPPVLREPRDND